MSQYSTFCWSVCNDYGKEVFPQSLHIEYLSGTRKRKGAGDGQGQADGWYSCSMFFYVFLKKGTKMHQEFMIDNTYIYIYIHGI